MLELKTEAEQRFQAGGLNATVGGLNAYEVTILLLAILVLRRSESTPLTSERRDARQFRIYKMRYSSQD